MYNRGEIQGFVLEIATSGPHLFSQLASFYATDTFEK